MQRHGEPWGRGRRAVLRCNGMTAQQDRRQALYDACRAVRAHQRAEIIDGTLYVLPRPAPVALAVGELVQALSEAVLL